MKNVRRWRRKAVGAGLGAIVAWCGACQEIDFESPEEISKLRPLGVQLEPAEGGPGEIVTARLLLASPDPEAEAQARVRWELCAFSGGRDEFFACPSLPDGTSLGIELGEGMEVAIDLAVLEAFGVTARALCDQIGDLTLPDFIELPGCRRGYDATLRYTITEADGTERVGIRTLPLLFDEEAEREDRNRNPALLGLLVDGEPHDPNEERVIDLSEGTRLSLQALVNTDDAQSYTFPDPANPSERLPALREQYQIAWHTTHGSFRNGRTFFAEGVAPPAELQMNQLRLAQRRAAQPGDLVRVWVVLRDDRGGVDWGEWRFRIAETQ
jgi:hypothetical protein